MAISANAIEGRTIRCKLVAGSEYLINFGAFTNTYAITLGANTDHADISNFALTGNLSFSGNTAYVDIPIAALTSNHSATKTFAVVASIFNGAQTETYNITIIDRYQTPAIYNLTASADPVSEGQTLVITLECSNQIATDTVSYTVTGVSSADINGASLTGSFSLTERTQETILGTADFIITLDEIPGETETLTLTLDNGGGSIDVDITENTPAPVYTLTGNSVTEGGTITWNFNATNVVIPDGTSINYAVSSSDSRFTGATSGSFTTTSNAGSFTSTTAQNTTYEGTGSVTATITTAPYTAAQATVNILDDEQPNYTNLISVPLAWRATYDRNNDQCVSLTPQSYILVPPGSTNVPTAVSVSQGSPSTVSITTTVGIDTTASAGGYKSQLITTFNSIPADGSGIVSGTTTDVIGYDIS
jgi:hypothetical protein